MLICFRWFLYLSYLMNVVLLQYLDLYSGCRWLLGYPVVYLFSKDHIEYAIYNLSTKFLRIYKILVHRFVLLILFFRLFNSNHVNEGPQITRMILNAARAEYVLVFLLFLCKTSQLCFLKIAFSSCGVRRLSGPKSSKSKAYKEMHYI